MVATKRLITQQRKCYTDSQPNQLVYIVFLQYLWQLTADICFCFAWGGGPSPLWKQGLCAIFFSEMLTYVCM